MSISDRLLAGAQAMYAANAEKRAAERAAALAALAAAKKKGDDEGGEGQSADTVTGKQQTIEAPAREAEAPAPAPAPLTPRLSKARAYDITD